MRRLSLFVIVAFAIVLTSTVTVTDGFAAKKPVPNHSITSPIHQTSHITDSAVLQTVSASGSANCLALGLVPAPDGFTGTGHGLATITSSSVFVRLNNAAPNAVYTVTIGYVKSLGCGGTWKSAGSIYTNGVGSGIVLTHLKLGSNRYMVELVDASGNIAYATSFMSM